MFLIRISDDNCDAIDEDTDYDDNEKCLVASLEL